MLLPLARWQTKAWFQAGAGGPAYPDQPVERERLPGARERQPEGKEAVEEDPGVFFIFIL